MTPSSFLISIFINLYEPMVANYGPRGSVAAQNSKMGSKSVSRVFTITRELVAECPKIGPMSCATPLGLFWLVYYDSFDCH